LEGQPELAPLDHEDASGRAGPPAVVALRRARTSRLRLVCVPHAGAGASAFNAWPARLPRDVEVYALQPLGRERRIAEPPVADVRRAVEAAADGVAPLVDVRYAVFGHSLGALVSFELVRELRRRGLPEPVHLVVSGFRAPHLPRRTPELHRLPDRALVAELRRLGGTPAAVFEHEELVALLLPAFRADLAIAETYVYADEPPLAAAVSAWTGRLDPDVDEAELHAWSRHTTGAFVTRAFPGGHSYPVTAQATLTATLAETLRPALEAA
jgi:medium-chain acyl-[acyl-carrier-protein] hydrolase